MPFWFLAAAAFLSLELSSSDESSLLTGFFLLITATYLSSFFGYFDVNYAVLLWLVLLSVLSLFAPTSATLGTTLATTFAFSSESEESSSSCIKYEYKFDWHM